MDRILQTLQQLQGDDVCWLCTAGCMLLALCCCLYIAGSISLAKTGSYLSRYLPCARCGTLQAGDVSAPLGGGSEAPRERLALTYQGNRGVGVAYLQASLPVRPASLQACLSASCKVARLACIML